MFRKNNMFFLLLLGSIVSCWAEDRPLNIVATQTIFADIVKQIGQDKVNVISIASPKYNIHFIQPKPSDVRRVAKADLYVNAGLDLEAWSDPLLEAAGNPQLFRNAPRNLDLFLEISLLNVPDHPPSRLEGDIHFFGNPHFQMTPANALVMAKAIAKKLEEIDSSNTAYYENNLTEFLSNLEKKISEWKKICAHCKGEEIISYHEDITYFADFLGLKAKEFLEPKPGIPPTPKQLAFLENYAREHRIKVIVLPTYYSRLAANELSHRTGAKVVMICQGVGEISGTEDFFSFFDYNFQKISEALR